jgi:hypothetical protein
MCSCGGNSTAPLPTCERLQMQLRYHQHEAKALHGRIEDLERELADAARHAARAREAGVRRSLTAVRQACLAREDADACMHDAATQVRPQGCPRLHACTRHTGAPGRSCALLALAQRDTDIHVWFDGVRSPMCACMACGCVVAVHTQAMANFRKLCAGSCARAQSPLRHWVHAVP